MSSPRTTTVRRRARRRTDHVPPRRTLLRASGVLALLLFAAFVAVTSYDGVPGRAYRTVYASVPQSGNLILHDQVRVRGVRVGQVLATSVDDDGRARLTLQLEPGVDLPADTGVRVRANGLLGARYVELVPGTRPQQLADGATVRGGEDSLTFGVSEALTTFDRDTRGALGTSIRELGAGLVGRGAGVNETLRVFRPALPEFRTLAAEILRPPGAVRRLLPSLDAGVGALDANRRDLVDGLRPASDALVPLVARRRSVQRTLERAPAALAAADAGLGEGVRLLAAARALVTQAGRTLPPATGGVRAATALLRESPKPLRRADALLRQVTPTVPEVLRVTTAASPLLKPLRDGLDELVPILHQVARYDCDIVNFATVFRSMTGFGGGAGEGPNGPAMAFRLQVIAPMLGESARVPDPAGLVQRDGYPEPCKYLSKPYTNVPVRVP